MTTNNEFKVPYDIKANSELQRIQQLTYWLLRFERALQQIRNCTKNDPPEKYIARDILNLYHDWLKQQEKLEKTKQKENQNNAKTTDTSLDTKPELQQTDGTDKSDNPTPHGESEPQGDVGVATEQRQ